MSYRTRHSPRIQREDPTDRPLIPNANDDEFEADTLDPSWSRFGNWNNVNAIDPGASFSTTGSRWSLNGLPAGAAARRSWFMVQADANTNQGIRKPITFPSEYFIWSRASFNYLNAGQTNNDYSCRLMISELVSGHYIDIALNESDANTVQTEFSYNQGVPTGIGATNNVGGAGATQGQASHTVGIQCLSGTYHGWVLSSTGNWIWMGSQVFTGTAPTHANLIFTTVGNTPSNAIGGFDFLRFKAGRYLP